MKKLIFTITFLLSLNIFGQIGINVPLPTEELDVNGTIKLRRIESISKNEENQLLVLNDSGVIKTMSEVNENPYTFIRIEFKIAEVSGDWLSNFDTKIPVEDYVVIITGFNFTMPGATATGLKPTYPDRFQPAKIYAFPSNGTWRLSADYVESKPKDSRNGTWEIQTIAINTKIIQTLPNVEIDLNGGRKGTLNAKPKGL
ncbi:hypothetical protein [Myroides injenensis]|uniref:hypothetical protein n=1 Tax=Myroides injenensis TaxID=1183151 RepID=UPI00226EDCD6|nr:hypothetical protein [Myroides injenensis]